MTSGGGTARKFRTDSCGIANVESDLVGCHRGHYGSRAAARGLGPAAACCKTFPAKEWEARYTRGTTVLCYAAEPEAGMPLVLPSPVEEKHERQERQRWPRRVARAQKRHRTPVLPERIERENSDGK